MITITKIFRFEAAHAIHGYPGACANLHGHSYELHVRVAGAHRDEKFIGGIDLNYGLAITSFEFWYYFCLGVR